MSASKQDIENQKELNKEMSQTKSNQKDINQEVEKNLSFEEEILLILNKRRGVDASILSDQQDVANVLQDQVKQSKFLNSEKKLAREISNKITKITQEIYTVNKKDLGTSALSNKLIKQKEELEKNIILAKQQQAKFVKMSTTGDLKSRELNLDISTSLGAQAESAQKTLDSMGAISKESETIEKSFGKQSFEGLAGVSEVLSKVTGLKNFSKPFKEASEAARKQAQYNLENFGTTSKMGRKQRKQLKEALKTGKGLNTDKDGLIKKLGLEGKLIDKNGKQLTGTAAAARMKVLGIGESAAKSISPLKAGFKSLGPIITKAMGPLALLKIAADIAKFFFDAMLGASKATAEMSRNMLISREQARELYKETNDITNEFNAIATAQDQALISSIAYRKALNDINGELGMQLNLTQDFGKQTAMNVAEVARMQQNFELSAKASTQLFLEAEKANEPLEDMNKSMFGTLGIMSAQSGLQLDLNKVIEEAAGISGNMRANFGGSTAEIAKAVFQAKVLGLNLSQMEGTSSSLLDFQSSIESEMAAELLTGKQLNLERAREAALMGDTKTLMTEITQQVGTQEEFLAMNIVQRKALAKAVGMEVNELADMFQKKSESDALAKKNLEIQNKLRKEGGLILDKNFDIEKASLAEIRIAAQAAGKSEAELRDILGDQIYNRKQEEDAQQKFNRALERAKAAFAGLVDGGALDDLVDILVGITDSTLFSGFKEEGKAKKIEQEAEKERKDALKSAGITEKTVVDEATGEEKIIQEIDKSVLAGKTDIQKEAIQAEIERTGANSSLAAEALEAQSQATGMDDTVDAFGAMAAGAATGAALGLAGGPFAPLTSTVGAIAGGLTGLAMALIKNSSDQKKADELLKEAEAIKPKTDKNNADQDNITSTAKQKSTDVDDFILRPGQPPIKFNKGDLLMGGTNLEDGVSSGGSNNNKNVEQLLEKLLMAVEKGGDIYMDGTKVGKSLVLASSRIG